MSLIKNIWNAICMMLAKQLKSQRSSQNQPMQVQTGEIWGLHRRT